MSLVESDGVIEDGIWEKKLVDELGQSLKWWLEWDWEINKLGVDYVEMIWEIIELIGNWFSSYFYSS
jgi:hypothetical protein